MIRPNGPRRRAVPATVVLAVLLAAGTSMSTASGTITPAPADTGSACPDPYPTSELSEGTEVSGLTVESGTEAEPFSGTVVGVIDDGVGPDADMIIAELDSPAIERAGGIWAGMSGSPVYAPDGRLVGAVAYGLSQAPSPVAGITPAEDMNRLLQRSGSGSAPAPMPTSTPTRKTTALPADIQPTQVTSGALPTADASTDAAVMHPLTLPMAVSGLSGNRLDQFSERMKNHSLDVRAYPAGSVDDDATGSADDIYPGSNMAAAISYGDVTTAAVGTTTAVCGGDRALGFGHPFLWSGSSALSVHPASAVLVQRDDVLGSFKVANPGGPVGVLDQDRQAGIRANLGPAPTTVPVTSTVTTDDGGSRNGTTNVTVPQFLADSALSHLWANFDQVLDRIGGGTVDLRWIIEGTRASGEPFVLDVANRYADQSDIAFASSFDSYDQLVAIEENEHEDVQITNVEYTADVSSTFARYSVSSLKVRQSDGSFETPSETDPLPVAGGSELQVRVTLSPYKGAGDKRNVDLTLEIPAKSTGAYGWVDVVGGAVTDDESEEDGNDNADGDGGTGAADFDQLLEDLKGLVPNNSVTATVRIDDAADDPSTAAERSVTETVDQVVVGSSSFPIEVVEK